MASRIAATVIATAAALVSLALGGAARAAAGEASAEYQASVLPVLTSRCGDCHGAQKQKAKLNFAVARNMEQLERESALWFRVAERMQAHEMPPSDEAQPSAQERAAVEGWINGAYTEALLARQKVEGRARLRRLNRTEYANTVQDLLGIRPTISLDLPVDGRVDGYDKVSAALPMSAASAGGYVKLTEEVLHWVLRPLPGAKAPPAPAHAAAFDPKRTLHAAAMESGQSPGHTLKLADATMVSFNSDMTSGRLDYPGAHLPGMHRIRLSLYGYQTDRPLAFGLYAGHTDAYPQLLDLLCVLEAPPGSAQVVETEVYLRTSDLNDLVGVNDKVRVVPFGIGVQVPKNSQASVCKGPGLAVQWMDIESPELPLPGDRFVTADFPPALDEELRRQPQAVLSGKHAAPGSPVAASINREGFLSIMHQTFARVGARLFRRDLSEGELGLLLGSVAAQIDDGVPLARAFLDQLALLMTSPDFLCVLETPGQLSDFALASRLSYFLWDSTPDETLLALARRGQLRNPKVLHEQTERLLDDARSARFVNDFLDQWLGLRAIDDTSPDAKLYPGYDDYLKLSSLQETRAYFRRLLKEDLPVAMLVSSPWVLANDALARHYGLAAQTGFALHQVALDSASPYGGLWTQCAVLKVTANGTATSPVKRGLWVANRLLGVEIPPPPPNVKPVDPDTRGATTLREQLALHRGSGSCAACHARFDPYGFALESFDVVGSFRTRYREADPEVAALAPDQRHGRQAWREGLAVDASGTTPAGAPFAGFVQLRTLLAAHPEALARGLVHHLVTYATGAPAGVLDRAATEHMVASAAAQGYGVRALVHAVVQSALFHWK